MNQSIRVIEGIILTLLSVFIFAVIDLVVKIIVNDLPVIQILFFRSLMGLPAIILIPIFFSQKKISLKTNQFGLQFMAGFFGLLALGLYFWGLASELSLAMVTSLNFMAAIFATMLTPFLLSETVGIHRWAAVIIGFIGVLLLTEPWSSSFNWMSIVIIFSAFLVALQHIAIKKVSYKDDSIKTAFWSTLVWTFFSGIILPFYWVSIDFYQLLILVVIGLAGGVGMYFAVKGIEYSSPSIALPLNYSRLVWAVIFGFFFFGDIPSLMVVLGAITIIISGLYIYYREKRSHEV